MASFYRTFLLVVLVFSGHLHAQSVRFQGFSKPTEKQQPFEDYVQSFADLDPSEISKQAIVLTKQLGEIVPNDIAGKFVTTFDHAVKTLANSTSQLAEMSTRVANGTLKKVAVRQAAWTWHDNVFWAPAGSMTRKVGDLCTDSWVSSGFATTSQKVQYAMARAVRGIADNPGKSVAIAAGAALVVGGIWHLWSKTDVTSGAIQQMPVVNHRQAEQIGLQMKESLPELQMATSNPKLFWTDFHTLELRSAQRLFLSECSRPNSEHPHSFSYQDNWFTNQTSKLPDPLSQYRNRSQHVDLHKLIAAKEEDADRIYPSLAPLRLASSHDNALYEVYKDLQSEEIVPKHGGPKELEIWVSFDTWNTLDELVQLLPRLLAFCQGSLTGEYSF